MQPHAEFTRDLDLGLIEISQGFQVPCSTAPQKINKVPRTAKKIVVTPKKPT